MVSVAERFRVTVFDKDLLKTISSGETDLKKISASLNVDWKAFQARATMLAKKGLIVFDEADSNTARLGIEGYNTLHSEAKPRAAKKRSRARSDKAVEGKALEKPAEAEKPAEPVAVVQQTPAVPGPETTSPQTATGPNQPASEQTIDLPYNPLIHGSQPTEELVQVVQEKPKPERSDEIDLVEVFEKYGVKKKQVIKEKLSELSKSIEDKPLSTTLATLAKEGRYESEEKCDLCKAAFRLSLGKDNHPKYGHCFCGAAYHKDCYETLLDNGGKCVRCGKKLVLMLDRQSEEAIKAVKKLFE